LKKGRLWKHLIAGIIIAGVALYLTYRKTDSAQLLQVLREMQWPLLLLVVPPLALSYWLRMIRWKLLLAPVEDVPLKTAAGPLITGFFVNSFIPGRVGELLRALLLSRKTSVPRAASFATVVLARIFDGLSLAAMTLLVLAMFRSRMESATRLGLMIAGVLYVLVLVLLLLLHRRSERVSGVLVRPLHWVGLHGAASRVRLALISFARGLDSLRNWRDTLKICLLSAGVWSMLAVSVFPVFWAMDLPVLWFYPILVIVLAGLGMLIPTPAGAGTIHGALVLVLPGLIAMTSGTARIFALLFHTTQFAPVILAGIYASIREGVTASQIGRLAESKDSGEATGLQV